METTHYRQVKRKPSVIVSGLCDVIEGRNSLSLRVP